MPDIFISDLKDEKKEIKKEAVKAPKAPIVEPKTKTVLESTKGHSHNLLSAFYLWPEKVDFENKNDEEKIILLLRRHIITNVGWILIAIIMLFAPMVVSRFPILDFLPGSFRFIAVLVWYLITTAYILENFLNWFFNVYIVTTERVIDFDFVNLIYKEVSDADINKIQDVTYKMGGVIRTLFNFGTVLIQTAAEVENFDFEDVPNPAKVASILQGLRLEEEKEDRSGALG